MSSSTQKHVNFVSEPMKDRSVTEIPGLGNVYCERLKNKNYKKAYQILAKYLELRKNEDEFKKWLREICGATNSNASKCYKAISEFSEQHI